MPNNPPLSAQNLMFSLLRADDLLALTLEFVNLTLDKSQTPPRLIRSLPGQDAFVIVHFPPQHIAEHVFNENTNGQPIGLVDAPVQSTLADTTRLAFRVPDTTQSIPFTLQDLLTWTAFDLSVAPNALPDGTISILGPGLAAPGPQHTAIEVPYRLILSPDRSAGWKHAVSPVTRDDRTELWHTRLGVRNGAGSGVNESRLPAVRAIWARDIDQATPADLSGSVPDGGDRIQIAKLSSDFTMQSQPPALTGGRLMLSASGAWTEVGGSWDFPTLDLHEWNQSVSMGRDQHVCVANAYFCCPFGHRVLVVQVVDRKLEAAPNGQETEYLIQRISIAPPQEGTRDYTTSDITAAYLSQGREMPFKQVTLSIPDHLVLDNLPSGSFFPVVSGTQFRFQFSAIDCDGHQVDFSLPLLFVPVGTTAEDIENTYNNADPSLRTADLRNQIVAFTPRPPSPPQPDPLHPQPGDSHLPTGSVLFTVQPVPSLSPPFLPEMDTAGVSVAAVDHLLGSSGTSGATIISFHDAYLQHGFDPDKNGILAFAQLPNSPLRISMPADKAGGLVTPNMNIDGLTCALGPVANTASLLSGDLTAFRESVDGNLLGGITLKQLINAVTDAPIELIKSQVPTLLTTQSADAVETSFEWHPDVAPNTGPDGNPLPDLDPQGNRLPPAPLVTIRDPNNPAKSTRLDISVVTRAPLDGGEPKFIVDGTLSNFALNFFNIVLVTFDQLHFHAERGKKVDVNPQGVHVEFIGALSLVNRLAELLPSNGFSDPPVLQVTPDGITAGYTLGIPAAGVGAFSLENIALAAQLALPFKDPAKLRLAFSERYHPFLVTVSLVGGGGFFAIEADTKGSVAVEGSLELGANITISLGIVEANAHVMMGFHFGLKGVDIDFIAYIRIGASVDLLGLVSVSIDMYLGLTFTPKIPGTTPPGILGVVGGVAALIIGVHLLFIDKSFTLSFERHFDIPARTGLPLVGSVPILTDPTFDEMVSEVDWQTYCQAFA